MLAFKHVLLSLVSLTILLVGCGTQTQQPPPPTATPMATATATATATKTPSPVPTVAPQSLSGRGQQVPPKFELTKGLAIFRMTHDGRRNFAIWLLDGNGERIELLVNTIGPFEGAKAIGIERPGTYVLDISADGNWRAVIEQPRGPAEVVAPTTFSGQGQQVSPRFSLGQGLSTFRMTHDGRRNFAIWLLDDNGQRVELLVNVIGSFDGAKAVGIKRAGTFTFDIAADGNWTVTIER
ncbi:MAG: hypothetical protein HYU86_11540 [Chloroflexi bacterium]|nr:hypothetical protein [Chloroflexota bacterium]